MENYTSDSSDSDSSSKVIDYAYLLLGPEVVNERLKEYIDDSKKSFSEVENLILHHNQLGIMPEMVLKFTGLNMLDISNNELTFLGDIFEYCQLTTLIAKNNNMTNESLPKSFTSCPTLRELNLSGNNFVHFPEQVIELVGLKYLYLGGNKIDCISKNICKLNQ